MARVHFLSFFLKTALFSLSLKVHAPGKGHGEHHDHGGQALIGKAFVFPSGTCLYHDNHQQGDNRSRAAHALEHLDFVFEGELPVRLLNKGH